MILTDAEKEAIRARLIAGVVQTRYGDRMVQYGSVEEQIKLNEYLKALDAAEILASSGVGPQRRSFVTFSRR